MSEKSTPSFEARIEQDLSDIRDTVVRYLQHEVTDDEIKPFRVVRGIFKQRQNDVNMIRTKVPLGRLTGEQLRTVADIVQEFADGTAHLTTRQDIQLYHVAAARVPDCIEALAVAGLTTRETGGNVVRNITTSALAGVDPQEVFDVTPYVEALFRHFLYNPLSQQMPRKIKMAVSGSARDTALAAINDIGLIARTRAEGATVERGFEVRVGGGLGASPESAHLLFEFVPTGQLLRVVEAIVRVFNREGDRNNRNRARLKFVLRRMGGAAFRKLVELEMEAIAEYSGIDTEYSVDGTPVETTSVDDAPEDSNAPSFDLLWRRNQVLPQKQDGFVSVLVWLPGGQVSTPELHALAEACERWGDGEVRASVQQNIVLRWVRQSYLPQLYEHLRRAGLTRPAAGTVADITSCPGAGRCRVGLTHSSELAAEISAVVQREIAAPDLAGATVKLSGCPHSCGHHHIATIGFHGAAQKLHGRHAPYYHLVVGGSIGPQGALFARNVGKIPARRVPQAVRRLIELFRAHRTGDETLEAFLQRVDVAWLRGELSTLLDNEVRFEEDLYTDWGDTEPFRIAVAEAECA